MEDLFYQNLRDLSHKRNEKWHRENLVYKTNGENIYALFVLTCISEDKRDKVNDDKEFARYLRTHNIDLTPVQRKYLAEKYFGWEYIKYDYESGKWEIKKVKQN